MKEIVLIEAPTNLGLKEPAPGRTRCKIFAAALNRAGFANAEMAKCLDLNTAA